MFSAANSEFTLHAGYSRVPFWRRICSAALAAGLIAVQSPGALAEESQAPAAPASDEYAGASQVVTDLHDKLIDVMKNGAQLGYEGRYKELAPVIEARFDTPLIVQVILSRYWDTLTQAQRDAFIGTFNQLSIATYASRFKEYDGEKFVELSREPLKKERLLIRTELQRPNDKPVKLDYLLHHTDDGRWLIISVIADGVNDLALKRPEYAHVIQEKGFNGLVKDLEKKIRDMESEPAT